MANKMVSFSQTVGGKLVDYCVLVINSNLGLDGYYNPNHTEILDRFVPYGDIFLQFDQTPTGSATFPDQSASSLYGIRFVPTSKPGFPQPESAPALVSVTGDVLGVYGGVRWSSVATRNDGFPNFASYENLVRIWQLRDTINPNTESKILMYGSEGYFDQSATVLPYFGLSDDTKNTKEIPTTIASITSLLDSIFIFPVTVQGESAPRPNGVDSSRQNVPASVSTAFRNLLSTGYNPPATFRGAYTIGIAFPRDKLFRSVLGDEEAAFRGIQRRFRAYLSMECANDVMVHTSTFICRRSVPI